MSENSHIAQMFGVKRETRGRQSDTQIDTYWKQLGIGKEYAELLNASPPKRSSRRAEIIKSKLASKYNMSERTIERAHARYKHCTRMFNGFDISNDDLSRGVK
mgnify:CR=1 FL=1